MKYVVIVPDGMADYPIEDLGNKTPLEVARTTNMDYLAQNGFSGLVQTIPDKMKPGSDIGNLALMGYNPKECFSGRAPLEAANLGVTLEDDEIAFRCNLVTIADGKMFDYSAGHISNKEAWPLIETLNKEIDEPGVRFIAGKSYRHLMIMKVRNVKDFLEIETTPPHDILGKEVKKYLPQGTQAPLVLKHMEKSAKILENHPINKVRIDMKENPATMIWLWGQGVRPQLKSFKDKFGVEGGIISAVDLVNGIGRLAGLEVIEVPGITGYYDTNYAGKGEYAINALKTKDFVFIHIEAPDEAGHNGHAKEKILAIEHIDREIVGPILNHFGKGGDFRILVLPDHPTPVALRTHTSDPVPFVMYGAGIPNNGTVKYNEALAKEKGIKFASGEAMMDYFMKKNI
jgi:2,3-bisphosphoglycerate-independent phosphoglycerate mutase